MIIHPDICTLTVPPWKQRLTAQHLCQDTPNTPHVNRSGIFFECEHYFWRAIPSRKDIISDHRQLTGDKIQAKLDVDESKNGYYSTV